MRDALKYAWGDAYRDHPSFDGVALFSAAHPRAAWYKRLWWHLWLRWRTPVLNPDSLETIEINMNDKEIEQEIVAKGKTAPRVTLAAVEACIAYEYYATGDVIADATTPVMGPAWKALERADITPLACLTLCILHLKNGFTVVGESACASPENFDAELGRKIARQKALDKVWLLEGYLLKEQLFQAVHVDHEDPHS